MTQEELNTIADLVAEKIWGKFAAVSLLQTMQSPHHPAPAPPVEPEDYISTDIIISEFGISKQWLYNQRKKHPQCSRLVKNNPYDQRGKRFWSRTYIRQIIHNSPEP